MSGEFCKHFRNRNLATPEFHAAIRTAIKEVLQTFDVGEGHIDDYEPFIGNVSYDIVEAQYEGSDE